MGLYRLGIDGGVLELLGGQELARGAAGLHRLELLAVKHPTAEVIDEGHRRDPLWDLVDTGPVDVAAEADHPGAGRPLGADALELIGAALDDERDVGQGLYVVQRGGGVVDPDRSREVRWLGPGTAAVARQ